MKLLLHLRIATATAALAFAVYPYAEPKVDQPPRAIVAPPIPLPCYCEVKVSDVHDGDTVRGDVVLPWGVTLRDQSIRAFGYDTCEVGEQRHAAGIDITPAELKVGAECRDAFKALLAGGRLYASPPPDGDKEPHGRMLARLTVQTKAGDTVDVGKWMESHHYLRSQLSKK